MLDLFQNTLFKIFLFIIGVVVGIVSFFIFRYFPDYRGILLVGANLALFTVFYVLITKKMKSDVSHYLGELAQNIEKISDGEHALNLSSNGIPELLALYKSIELLRQNLKMQNRTKDTVLNIVNAFATNISLSKMLDELLPKIIEGTNSMGAAFYMYNSVTDKLELKSSLGFSKNIYKEFDVSIGEGMIGRAALHTKIQIVNDISDDAVYVTRSFTGKIKPKALMAVPIISQKEPVAVLALATIFDYTKEQFDIVNMVRHYIGVAIANGLSYENAQRLSNEMQFQNKLIQNMNEELEEKINEKNYFLNSVTDIITTDGVISIDKEWFITSFNKSAEIITGFTFSEVAGRHYSVVSLGEDAKIIEAQFEKAFVDGFCHISCLKKRKNGDSFHADVSIWPVYQKEKNGVIGYVVIMRETLFA